MKKVLLIILSSLALASCSGQFDGSEKAGAELALRQNMRKLWTDHTVWTRSYIIAAIAGMPDVDAAANRLMKNQDDIGHAFGAYYGAEAGDQLTMLLKEHIRLAVVLIDAAKLRNTAEYDAAVAKWRENGQAIADFLAKANPSWPQQELRTAMDKHLSTTVSEVVARLDQEWAADVQAYDEAYDHILMLSDTLASGIIKQFPDRF